MSSNLRLRQTTGIVTGQQASDAFPWNPDSSNFPSRKELPRIGGAPEGAAWVWGKDDNLGRLNLLTPRRVRESSSEIKTGELTPVNLPLNIPETPAFHREKFEHSIKMLAEDVAFDDVYHLNTQSSTQWDGFRHFAHMPTKAFYNGAKAEDFQGPHANMKCSVHHWAEHGIAGRGILLDYRAYAKSQGIHYDPYEGHDISFDALQRCGKAQGIDIRPSAHGGDIRVGDILLIRSGFVERYLELTPHKRRELAERKFDVESGGETNFTGVKQDDAVLDWLHDCYFAAVAGDAPAFERWPPQQEYYLHEYILSLWGMPLGEMWNLEKLAEKCAQRKRWTFFLTSSPANVPGGVGTHANATAIM